MIYCILKGGLGNQLFQCSFAYALQKKEGKKVTLDLTSYLFCKSRKADICKLQLSEVFDICYFPKKLRKYWLCEILEMMKVKIYKSSQYTKTTFLSEKIQEINESNYNDGIRNFNVAIINGYFQSEIYFSEFRTELLKLIIPNTGLKPSCVLLEKIKYDKNSVSLHIRRGDYVDLGINLALDYYYAALSYLDDKLSGNFKIYVFSDDINWARENLQSIQYKTEFIHLEGENSSINELILMSKCRHNIIANSTFSWWGAWLNENPEKIVIAPKQDINNLNFIPKEWVRI